MNKKLSNLMLLSNLLCTVFYAMSYPYVYAETVKAVSHNYISFENIIQCIGIALFGVIWNKYGNKLFKYYIFFVIAEIIADTILFGHVLITGNLKFYFILNVLIFSIITKNMACGGVKMRALVHPDSESREKYDNNSNTVSSIATLTGSVIALCCNFNLTTLFILAYIGNVIDNFFYLYIYHKLKEKAKNDERNPK